MPTIKCLGLQFQSTHPRGVRLVLVCGRCKDTLVSIHAPTRGATDKANDLCPHQSVSIHAPTRGATTSTSCRRILQTVSIHAPTRGATDKGLLYRGWHLGFNPRTHEGCDIYCSVQFISVLVSIHAPTRGATDKTERHFNVKMFQSTHPRGVRHRLGCYCQTLCCFNPRTHEGCDVVSVMSHVIMIGFNPRTHEGCDLLVVVTMLFPTSFNPRTHEGCDKMSNNGIFANRAFQSTHPRGVRHIYLDFKDYLEKFQSTHPRGVRQKSLGITLGNNGFNPRTHEGCDVD